MKKIITLLAVCFLAVGNIKAQKVYIPDPNVRVYLQNLATSCKGHIFNSLGLTLADGFDGDSMIVANFQNLAHIAAGVAYITNINLSNKGITTMEGMQYIIDIDMNYIDLSHNLIDNSGYRKIPAADHIGSHNNMGGDGVNFSHNLLSGNLDNFIQSLSGYADYSYNNFTSGNFGGDRTYFYANHNAITGSVNVSGSIGELNLDSNLITSVSITNINNGAFTNPNYYNFNFSHNNISSFPIINIDAYYTTNLNCNFSYNKISSLGTLTATGSYVPEIMSLNLSNNLLASLSQNSLVDMTAIVGIKTLDLSNNIIACLPEIPNNITTLNIQSTNVQCIYNKPSGVSIVPNLPICNNTNNLNNCPVKTLNYVNIPDFSFGSFLMTKYPSCLFKDANNLFWMDTTCNAVVTETQIDCKFKSIISLEGIQYFKNLNYLDCGFNDIDTFKSLPSSLRSFLFNNNPVKTFPSINDLVEYVDMSATKFSHITSLPTNLKHLIFYQSPIDTFPTLPNGLIEFSMHTPGMAYLGIDPFFNPRTPLSKVPNLPSSLKILELLNGSFTSLPTIPNSVEKLVLNNLFITAIPNLSDSLKFLDLWQDSSLTCLPKLPSKLNTANISNVPLLKCLPNIPSGITTTLPVCNSTNNPNNCPILSNSYVNIPDTSFGKFLLAQYPSCLYKDASNLYWMDTTCSGVVNETDMNVPANCYAANFIGTQYFKSLKSFYFNNYSDTVLPNFSSSLRSLHLGTPFNLKTISNLPDSLTSLVFEYGGSIITNIAKLPFQLEKFVWRNAFLKSLPILPNTLRYLDIWTNSSGTGTATNLINKFPDSLRYINVGINDMDYLPALPNYLDTLYVQGCSNLYCLPKLPNSLKFLETTAFGTQFTCLPNIPSGLATTLPVCSSTNNPNNCTTYPANYVNIPDTSFGKLLLSQYPSCLYKDVNNLYWMDTTCSSIVNATFYFCNNSNISNLDGIQYFDNLTMLYCINNEITSLSNLPNTILYLYCDNNKLTSLPVLPLGLIRLSCGSNKLTNLPALPNNLGYLYCSNNQTNSLPTLPNSLFQLDCSYNNLNSLPSLPSGLYRLNCDSNQLTSLPSLPNSLGELSCSKNKIANLPNLPSGLYYLACNSNQLSNLPTLPNGLKTLFCKRNQISNFVSLPTSLTDLYCDSNQLTILPILPKSLRDLSCGFNQLSHISDLPLLNSFDCSNNPNISCIEILPPTLVSLNVSNTNIQCLPNTLAVSATITPAGLPICNTTFNPNSCTLVNSWVNIPDPNFRAYLISQIPACFNTAQQLDTLCSGVYSLTNIQCNNLNIQTLEGVQYFKKMAYLDCSYNNLPNLPYLVFPTYYGGAFVSPYGRLNCSHNQLTSLPALTPNSLYTLDIGNNLLTSLDVSGLSNLYSLHCDSNALSSIVFPVPLNKNIYDTSLGELYMHGNNIYCLPKLSGNLRVLQLDNNKILCLPNYPKNTGGYTNIPYTLNQVGNPVTMEICNPANNANQCIVFPVVKGKVFTDANSNGIKDATEFYRPYVMVGLNNYKDDSTYTWTNNIGEYFMSAADTGNYTVKATSYWWNWNWWWNYNNPNLFKPNPDSINLNFSNNYSNITLADIAIQPTITKDSVHISFTNYNHSVRPNDNIWNWLQWDNWGTTKLNATITVVYDSSKIDSVYSYLPITSHIGNIITYAIDTLQVGQWGYGWLNFHVKTNVALGDSILATAYITTTTVSDSSKTKTLVVASWDPNDKQATPALSTTQVANGELIDYTIRFQNVGTATAINIVVKDSISSLLQNNYLVMDATSHNTTKITLSNGVLYFEFLGINLPDSGTNQQASHGFIRFKLRPINTVTVGTVIPNKASIYFDYNSPVITNVANTIIKTIVTPVKLIDYRVQLTENATRNERKVLNEWLTANEINASHFNVQRSVDGFNFKTIGQVKAVGASRYSFIDNSLSSNDKQKAIFYRLQMVDNDGRFEYSPIREINLQPSISNIRLYPNPAKDMVTVECASAKEILITDYFGRIKYKAITNNQLSIINVQGFAKGIYLVQVVLDNGSIKTEKLIIE